jgi:hypothetical protein
VAAECVVEPAILLSRVDETELLAKLKERLHGTEIDLSAEAQFRVRFESHQYRFGSAGEAGSARCVGSQTEFAVFGQWNQAGPDDCGVGTFLTDGG